MQNVMQALYLTRNARGLPASVRRYSNDLIMPGHPGAKKELTAALKSGQIKRSELEVAAANVLNVIFSSNVWSINE